MGGILPLDVRTLAFIVILAVGAVVFVYRLKDLLRYSGMRKKTQKERESFLTTFDPSEFVAFDAFAFQLWSFSHVGPFPRMEDGEWRYAVYLTRADAEDENIIAHEITECTLGRIIERLLQLKKPLYLMRKEDDKLWISGKQQKYLVEHVLATLSEIGELSKEKLEERLAAVDVKAWQLVDQ